MKAIVAANRDYEAWLARELGGDFVADDLKLKHRKMRGSAFAFLRATYWRWAEAILQVCPDLAGSPGVLAVGDIHLENFGTWTDREGRIVWGVNDFDETAEMPYALDLVRLGASAVLAGSPQHMSLKTICGHILDGYRAGLEAPEPFVLDRRNLWLRRRFVVDEARRKAYWRRIDNEHATALKAPVHPPPRWREAFAQSLPEKGIELAFWRHTAGTGSLGRARWLAYARWRGGPILREAKALVSSGWVRARGGNAPLQLNDIAQAAYRAPDPWYAASGNLLVRRVSPNNRKLDIEDRTDALRLLHPRLLDSMGHDLAAVHLGTRERANALRADLAARRPRWFRAAVETAAEFVRREYSEWKKSAR